MGTGNELYKSKCSTLIPSETHSILLSSMELYRYLTQEHQAMICEFVVNFYKGKTVYISQEIVDDVVLLTITAANAALVGAAQRTEYFSSVKWLYFCTNDLDVAGDCLAPTSVRFESKICLEESKKITPGNNLVVHEFAHVLDSLLGICGSTKALREVFRQCWTDLRNGKEIAVFPADADISSEIEFFAVASELFFTSAAQLKEGYPELYSDLLSIYGLDTAALIPLHKTINS